MKQGKGEDAYREAQSALFIFEQDEEKDFHYSICFLFPKQIVEFTQNLMNFHSHPPAATFAALFVTV